MEDLIRFLILYFSLILVFTYDPKDPNLDILYKTEHLNTLIIVWAYEHEYLTLNYVVLVLIIIFGRSYIVNFTILLIYDL